MQMKKSVCCIVCVLMVLSTVPSGIFADSGIAVKDEQYSISPRWTGVAWVDAKLIISGETVKPQVIVEVDADKVTKVTSVGELKKKVNGRWVTVGTWDLTKQVTTFNLQFNQSYEMETGFEYTYVTTIKAYNGTTLLDTIDVEGPVKRN